MSFTQRTYLIIATAVLCGSLTQPRTADATIVEFQTVLGNFQVNLYDNATPLTVANFLNYVQTGGYTDSIIHRSVQGFVVQGGGFNTDVNAQINPIPANPAVTNEPVFSNVRGSIAMAKVGGNPNSATNQWFFNLANNAADLDAQNGGFTAFGEVTGNGMTVVDAIAALTICDRGGVLTALPLRNFLSTDCVNAPGNADLVIVTAINVVDTTVDSAGAAGLNPTPTTNTGGGGPSVGAGGGGGGSFGLLAVLSLFAFGLWSLGQNRLSRD